MDRSAPNEQDLHALFARLFPNGFGGDDVREEIAPEGWSSSLLRACRRRDVAQPVAVHDKPSDDTRQEMCELVAACLWDIFSDNHDVIMRDGRQADIGSFRGAAGFLADHLNTQMGAQRYDYMDFYMGTIWLRDRADLSPVYRMIFHRCQREGCDWHRQNIESARRGQPPPTVQAYYAVYSRNPLGWPP